MAAVIFDEVRFPTNVSYGSSGGPTFKTQVFETYRGYEKRNVDWKSPIMEFNVAYGIKTDAQMFEVIEFFNARQGKLRGFRYKNWANYQILNGNIAVGDGISTRLPMIRTYGVPATQSYKRLYKIVPGSVSGVTIGGFPLVEGVDFNIDYNSGEIVFKNGQGPGEGIPIKAATLEFDEPVRFDVDSLQVVIDGYNNNNLSKLPLIGIRDTFTYGTVPSPDAATFTLYTADDPYYSSTRLLLKFNDTANLATTEDDSRYNESVTITAPATLTTATSASGLGSLVSGATGYTSVPGTRFDFSNPNAPFDVELYLTRPSTGELYQPIIGKWVTGGSDLSWLLRYEPAQKRLRFGVSLDGTTETDVLNYPWVEFEDDTWQHVAISRLSSGLIVMRIQGETVLTSQSPGTLNNTAAPVTIGGFASYGANQGSYQGGIDSVRITYGRTRYPGIGNVPVPAADYPV
jgi:uncharacterized protein (TIGR02217 family)